MQFRPLGKSRRQKVRKIARAAYMLHSGSKADAKKAAEDRIKTEFVASSILASLAMKVLISLAISLAVKLIAQWALNQLTVPPMQYRKGEPGYEPGDER